MRKFIIILILLFFCFGFSSPHHRIIARKNTVVAPCTTSQQAEDGASDGYATVGQYSVDIYQATQFSYSGTTGKQICQINLWLSKEGSPTDNYYVGIWGDDAGNTEPDNGNILGTCDAINSAALQTSETEEAITCSTPTDALTNGTLYWVVMYRDGSANETNYVEWYLDEGGTTKNIDADTDGAAWADESSAATLKFELISQ